LLNSALAAIRVGQVRIAVDSATRALERLELNDADKGALPISALNILILTVSSNAAKALYRRALGYSALKDDDEAERDLVRAQELVKDDAAIIAELEKVRARKKEKRDKEKKAFKKLFS
jgi:peptidyl-prolyl isomerase D